MGLKEEIQNLEESPFYLKRKGEYEKALKAYSHVFASALASENRLITETCFDQIFDIQLLIYARDETRFSRVKQLQDRLRRDVQETLKGEAVLTSQVDERLFSSCWSRFIPKGRGLTKYSVDSQYLIPSEIFRES